LWRIPFGDRALQWNMTTRNGKTPTTHGFRSVSFVLPAENNLHSPTNNLFAAVKYPFTGQSSLHICVYLHTLHHITLHYITLHCIALHWIALHFIALHCIICIIDTYAFVIFIHTCFNNYSPTTCIHPHVNKPITYDWSVLEGSSPGLLNLGKRLDNWWLGLLVCHHSS